MIDLEIHTILEAERHGWSIYHKYKQIPKLGYIPPSLDEYWWYDDPWNPNNKIMFFKIPEDIREYLQLKRA